jgi:hypothetical protein
MAANPLPRHITPKKGRQQMMENMIGDLARVMQEDRRARAATQAHITEAERAYRPHSPRARLRERRAAIANMLIALATRLAPPATAEAPRHAPATPAAQ